MQKLFSFSMQLQIRHYKTKYRSIPFLIENIKKEKKIKLATKRKKKGKNTASANINSREVLKIE